MPQTTKPTNPLNAPVGRFDVAGISRRSIELGVAAEALDDAFHASYAIECIAQMLIADDSERDSLLCQDETGEGQPLSDYIRGGLQTAIYSMAKNLHNSLGQKAEEFGLQLTSKTAAPGATNTRPA